MGFDSLILNLVGLLTIILTLSKRMKKFIKKHKWTLSIWISAIILLEVYFCMNYQLLANKFYNVWFRLWYSEPDPADFIGKGATYQETTTWSLLCPAFMIIWTSYEFFSSIKEAIKQNRVLVVNWIVGIAVLVLILLHAIYHVIAFGDGFAVYMRNWVFWLIIILYNTFSLSKWTYKINKKVQYLFLPDVVSKENSGAGDTDKNS